MFDRRETSPSTKQRGALLPSSTLDFESMNTRLKHTIGYSSFYPYLGEKPGGTDVGHLIGYQKQRYIFKAGITLSLLGQALENIVKGEESKAKKKLETYILGNYTRIAGIEDTNLIEELKVKILSAFDNYLLSEQSQQLQASVRGGHKLDTHDVYQIYLYLCNKESVLKDVIGLPAFSDIVSGCHSQQFNNVFQLTQNNTVAQHKLFMQPQDQPGIFQGSMLLEPSTPFDKFLLNPFKTTKLDSQSEEEWIAQGQNELKQNLQTISLKGLCSGILIRHIMGESADNGPDNMILVDSGVVNIDLTGFRYPRQDRSKGALGWAETLASNTADDLLEKLFDPSVFKDRFVKDSALPEHLQASIYAAIVTELKLSVEHAVVEEVIALRQWLAKDLDLTSTNKNLAKATRQVYAELNPQVKFSEKYLNTLIAFNQQFIRQAIEVAKTCESVLESSNSYGL